MNQKNNLVKNASFLMIAAMISKVIGLLYKSPLSNIIGSLGMGYTSLAQNAYMILLMIASFSIPQAVSKLISERIALKDYRNAHKFFKGAMIYAMVIGGVVGLFCLFGAGLIIPQNQKDAIPALQILAPTIFLSGILGVFRGYFQAYRNMMPTSISQIIEQVFNAAVSLLAAWGFINAFSDGTENSIAKWGAAGSTVGTGAGVVTALAFMLLVYGVNRRKILHRVERDHRHQEESYKEIFRVIILVVSPIILSAFVYNVNAYINGYLFSDILGRRGGDAAHAIITADAMTMGKHVYCQKPLTHSVYESRLLTKLAASTGVVTQMGNQGASDEGTDLVCEWIWNGEIGDVTKVECATDRPIWPQGLNVPEKVDKIPSTLNWDLFTGPAKMNPYNAIYHPWNWRGWWDYGTGALGDMACHILHQPFRALKLQYPTKVEGSSTLLLNACAPQAQHVKMIFPARENMPKVAMPEVEVHWYDGGMMPERPKGFPEGKQLMQSGGGLTIFHGTKDTLICGCYGQNPWLLSGRKPNAPKVCRRVPKAMNGGHEMDWVRACKEDKSNRIMTKSDFSEAGPMNEMVAMGVLAIRLQALNKTLEWDGANMCFTNIGDNETIRTVIKDGFKIHNGHPTFDKTWTDPINAKQFAAELVKHNYREGWRLPDMPR